ncbi:hypothetical protein AAFF_G00073170 [Aldrovandia affinis]|uniref:Transposase n=1 Tax=Aldrovandia affinis TaxID=143900 RepID=A0AAD7RYP7_9TELE|nr:hypothetical protein AAFF_G00073170 [Aldrovandia affinis]
MGKKKQGQPAGVQFGDNSQEDDGRQAEANQEMQQTASNAPPTLADMEKLLKSTEDRIIAKLSIQLSANRVIIDRHEQTIQEVETKWSNHMETRLTTLESTCSALTKENEALRLKTDDLENRSRRNNIRITGLPEKVEGSQLNSFIEVFLKETFGATAEAFPTPPVVDRAHRIATPRKRQDDPPRPFIAWMHHFQTKERILTSSAREAGSLSFRGTEVHIYPDYSAEVSKKRAAYFTVKSQLRNARFTYRMFFPAKLQVTDKHGQKLTLPSPGEVSTFLANNLPGTSLTPTASS